MNNHDSIHGLLEYLLNKMLFAEEEILEQLQMVCESAESGALKEVFSMHIDQTVQQIDRLKRSLQKVAKEPEGILEKGKELMKTVAKASFSEKSEAIDGIIKEGRTLFKEFSKTKMHDLVIASSAQSIEMGEIAAYRILCLVAKECGQQEILSWMQETLNEELRAYEALSEISDREAKRMPKAI